MSLAFRQGRADDVPAVARLVQHSFPAATSALRDTEDYLLDSPHGGLETLWVGERDGRVIAACRLLRFRQWIGGRDLPIMGLATVAIAPTERRQGIAARLIESAFEHARDRGDAASLLYPFRTSFYRKLGYGIAGEAYQFRIPPTTLPDSPLRARVRLVESEQDRADLAAVYDRWAPLQTGQLVRPPRGWEPVWQRDTRHGAIYRNDAGVPTGYVIFRYLSDPPRGGRGIDVEEIAWLDPDARAGLYGWLSSLSDQWDQLIIRAHPEENFADHLAELRFPADQVPRWHYWFSPATILHGPMFRLLDLPEAWNGRALRGGPAVDVALEVHDPQVPANSGTWTLHLGEHATSLDRGSASPVRATLRMNIETLSRIYIGALTPAAAVASGLATGEGVDRLLDRRLRIPRPWTFDHF